MSSLEEENARTAALEHAVALGRFVKGEAPPTIVEDESTAREIVTGIAHMEGVIRSQRELIGHYEKWAGVARARMVAGYALIHGSPTLEAWRKATIADRRKPLLDRLAAWEMTAVMCDMDGNTELAEQARQTAKKLAANGTPTRPIMERDARTA